MVNRSFPGLAVDGGLPYPQNRKGRKIAVIVLVSKSNRLEDLLPLVPAFR
jgi:hypothetical protein